ncbi:MAG: nickel pincer cofactor biosynthesis protein LarC [Verrucomicrobia bacterium]|nr:nickel pincer cofactor biosynthesis protein LarC [Verrucomicrobiota bacterium]
MKTLYFDCFSGISGDMAIAALLDMGASFKRLESELRKLGIAGEYHLHKGRGHQQLISGTRFDVHTIARRRGPGNGTPRCHHHRSHGDHHNPSPERTWADIRRMISRSGLSPWVRDRAIRLFHRLAVVEGKIHGTATEKVHFHEVGAVDSIVDIVGVCILLEEMAPGQILASVPCEGRGFIECAHGRYPVPTPAAIALLKGIPMQQIDVPGELITPTGAAILAEFVGQFGPISGLTVEKVGYGLGSRSYANHPNALRVFWGEAERAGNRSMKTAVDVIETNVDDVSPEIVAAAMERLLAAGALDVYLTPIQMKKNRPGALITMLSAPTESDRLGRMLLLETGSFGLRIRRSERVCLAREVRKIKTRLGTVEIKVGVLEGKVVSAKPEFESCRKLAAKLDKPVRIIWTCVLAECSKLLNRPADC